MPMPKKQGWAVVLVISRLIIILVSFPFATLSRIVRQRKGRGGAGKVMRCENLPFPSLPNFLGKWLSKMNGSRLDRTGERDHRRRPSCLWWSLWRGFTIIINSINPRTQLARNINDFNGQVNSFPLNKSQIVNQKIVINIINFTQSDNPLDFKPPQLTLQNLSTTIYSTWNTNWWGSPGDMTIFQNACHSDWTDWLVAIQIVQSCSVGRPHGCENNPPESWHNQMTRHPPPQHANGLSENDSHDGPQSHNHLSLQSPLITWVIYFISHPNLGASNTIASKSTSPWPPMTFPWKIDWGRSTYQGSLKNLQGFGHSISRNASYRFRLYYVPEKGSSSSPK